MVGRTKNQTEEEARTIILLYRQALINRLELDLNGVRITPDGFAFQYWGHFEVYWSFTSNTLRYCNWNDIESETLSPEDPDSIDVLVDWARSQ